MKVKEFLSSEDKWTKDTYARNVAGVPVSANDKTAVCWCLNGALDCCYVPCTPAYHKAAAALHRAISLYKHGKGAFIHHFNDRATSFDEITAVLELADI